MEQTNNIFNEGVKPVVFFGELDGFMVSETSYSTPTIPPRRVVDQFKIMHTSTAGVSTKLVFYSNKTNKFYQITATQI
jgi:hypothetical protein